MGVSVEVKGGWRINAFLFLLTGSQAVFLPWSSVILKGAGLSAASVGTVMGATTFVGSLGVIGCLRGIRTTHSGAARRLMLLLLTASASAFYIFSVFLLPITAGGNACVASFTGSSGLSNTHVLTSHNNSQLSDNKTTLASVVGQSSLTPVKKITTTTTSTTMTPATTTTMTTVMTTTTTEKVTKSSSVEESLLTSDASATILSSVELTSEKYSETASSSNSHDKTGLVSKNSKQMTTSTETTTVNDANPPSMPQQNSTQADHYTVNEGTVDNKTTLTTQAKKEKPKIPMPGQTKYEIESSTLVTGNGMMSSSGNGHSIPNNLVFESTGTPGTFQSSFESSNQKKGTALSKKDAENPQNLSLTSMDSKSVSAKGVTTVESDTTKIPAKGSVEGDEIIDNSSSFDSNDDSYYYDNEEDSDYSPSFRNSGVQNLYSPRMPKTNDIEAGKKTVKPLPPSQHLPKESDRLWSSKNLFRKYNDKPQMHQMPKGWQQYYPNSRSKHKDPYLQKQYESQAHSNRYSDYEPNRYYPINNEYSPQGRPLPKAHGRPSLHHNRNQHRGKRSIHSLHTFLDDESSMPSKKNQKRRGPLQLMNETDNSSQNDDKISIRSFSQSINSPVGIQAGVVIFLILGSLVGAGIEMSVAKLWHCYSYGYDEGGVNQDIIERTITLTFQLTVYASHKVWSGLTSAAWVVSAGVMAGLICMMGAKVGVYGMLGGIQLALGMFSVFMVLLIPVPYGSVEPPKTKRPLSLYLDDEVLREGVRRLAFHFWVFANGCVSSLPVTFGLWLILEMTGDHSSAIAAQTGAVAIALASESLTLLLQRWLMARAGLQGIMGIGGLAMMFHLTLMWTAGSVGVAVVSYAGYGCCMALLWVSVRQNALLLATVNDQEREAWASWWCWRIGVGVGAIVWGFNVDAKSSISGLFKPASFISASIALAVATAAVVTRKYGRTRRRVYHTLDLMAGETYDDDDEDDDEDDANEDDWLVKRAKKEGIDL